MDEPTPRSAVERRLLLFGSVLTALSGLATPAVGQDTVPASLCLFVEVPAGVTSVDVETATTMIASGEMVITDVVPCDGSVRPPARTPRTESSDLPGTTVGPWFMSEMLAEPTDGTIAIAGMNAVEGVSSLGAPVTFAVRCRAEGIDALVTWEDVIEAEHPTVTFTYGSGASVSVGALRSSDRTATFYPTADIGDLLVALGSETVMEVTLRRGDGTVLRAVFDVRQADEALTTVREACATS